MGSGTMTPATSPSSLSVITEIVTLAECLAFMGMDSEGGIYEINATNDVMVFTSDEGGPVNTDIPDGTYNGNSLATALSAAMNADDTLTGTGTITFVVSFSSTTYKFSIDAGSGKTIAYTHTGSDAGLTLGFTEDASASQNITSDTGVPGDPSSIVESIHDGVEKDMVTDVRDSFNSTIYRHQLYSGDGSNYLRLRNWPITVLSSVALSTRSVMQIRNTSSDLTRATVSVDVADQEMRLLVVGGANAGTNTFDLSNASYDTIGELITAIDALGSGWDAAVEDSRYDDLLSIELIEVKGLVVADIEDNGNPAYEELFAPDPLMGVTVNEATGMMYYSGGWPDGYQNVMVSYTGGFSTIPNDLKRAVLRWVKMDYDKHQESADGVKTITGLATYVDELPAGIKNVLEKYRDVLL